VDVESIRAAIPALHNSIYLNTGTFGPMPATVTQEIIKAYEMVGEFGGFSPVVRQKIERDGYESARASVAKLLNVGNDQIALTRSASDGICIIAYGLDWKAGDEVVVTDQEHPSGELPWINLHKRFGVEVRVVRIADDPNLTLQRFSDALTERTRLVFASHVTSSIGERLPAREICKLVHDKGKLAAIDGSHALGQFAVDLREIKPDFYVTCGHKWLLGPQGTGMLYVAPEHIERIAPSWIGWGAQRDYSEDLERLDFELHDSARRYEFGTKPWPLFLGLTRAIDFIQEIGTHAIERRVHPMATRFKKEVEQIPGVRLLTPCDESRSTGMVSAIIENYHGTDLRAEFWGRAQILVSSHEPKRRVRFSVAFFNTEDELGSAVDVLRSIAAH
jgi:selenocysteine lyase/cysteine desulfurase